MARLVRRSQGPVLAALTAVLLVVCSAANAMADSVQFDIAAQAMPQALKRFAAQAHVQLLFDYKAVEALKTPAVRGRLEAADALEILLRGTGLTFQQVNDHTIAISRAKPTSDAQTAPNSFSDQEAKKESSSDFRLAQATPGQDQGPVTVDQEGRKSAPESQDGKGMAEILIKGSRTLNIDVVRSEDDVQPYTIFDSKKIEQSGATNVEDFLKQQLTMNTQVQTNAQAYDSFTGTTSSINLRGLGTNETLILIDGRRSAGVNNAVLGNLDQPDINGIPLSAIDRIEVLPSSASAIYGGAAVGGVVNIILKKNFTGGSVSYTVDRPIHSDAYQRTVNGSYGFTLGEARTQIMVGGQYSSGDPLLLKDRQDLFDRGVSTILSNSPSFFYTTLQPFPGATPNIASASSFDVGCLCFPPPPPLTLRNGTPLNSPITSIAAGAAPGSDLSAGLLANSGKYNLSLSPGVGFYGLQSPFGTVPTTKSAFATIRQTLFDDIQVFGELSTNGNAGHTFFNAFDGAFLVPSTAPTNPFQEDVDVTFPSSLASPQDSDSVTRSATVGFVVPLRAAWSSEIDYTWSKNSFEVAAQVPDSTAFNAALSAGTINPFADTVAYPLDLAPYLGSQRYSGEATLNDLNLRASGPVGSLPAGRPSLTIGLEHRKEGSGNAAVELDYPLTPANNVQQIFFGQSQSTDSVYVEGLVPLVGRKNAIPGIDALELQVAARSERYTVHAGTPYEFILPVADQAFEPPQGIHTTVDYTSTNPVVGLKYQPVHDVVVRASYSTAFLPPTPAQLLPNPTPVCGFQCQPITDPKSGQTYNIDFTQGGNPNLQPQKSRDTDVGVIWEPTGPVLSGLRADLEYYRITQPNYITNPTPQQVVSDPAFASRVTRDPATGLITIVDTSFVNATEYKTSGWDVKIDYRKAIGLGTVGLHAAATLIKYDLRQYSIASPFLDYAGYPNDGGEGKIKGNATLSWEYRKWTVAWTATYYSSYWQQFAPGSPLYLQFGPDPAISDAQGGYSIPSQAYHDVYVSYVFGSDAASGRFANALLSNLTLQFGVRNVFNTPPPFDALYKPYFYSPFGDVRMRDFRITLAKAF